LFVRARRGARGHLGARLGARRGRAWTRVRPDASDRILHALSSFALYSFPESHALSFALIAYTSAYLKTHRPAEFYVGLEDETGVANAIVYSDLFEASRLTLTQNAALIIEGTVQAQDGVIHLKAERIEALRTDDLPAQASHDFH